MEMYICAVKIVLYDATLRDSLLGNLLCVCVCVCMLGDGIFLWPWLQCCFRVHHDVDTLSPFL